VLRPFVGRAHPLLAVAQAPPFEQALDARYDRRKHIRDIRRRERRGGTEAHGRAVFCKHAVDNERVGVNIQIQRPAEALNDRHPSTLLGMALSTVEGPRRDTGRDPTPAGSASDAGTSTPTVSPAPPGTRDPPDARRVPPSVARRPSTLLGTALSIVEGPQLAHTALPLQE